MTHNLDSPVVEEIFKIKHRASKSSLAECIDLFVEYLEADLTPSTTTPAQDVRQALTSVLKDESNGISIVWLEEFDSAILASKDNLSSQITIDLIYLDGWTCPIMSDVQGGRETVATSCHSNTFCLGQVSSDEDSFRKISKIISAPSFNSWWKIKDVPSLLTHIQSQLELTFGLKCEKTSHGLPSHVIKNKRGALWSLVMEVIKVITNDHLHGFFKEMEVDFYLWLLKTMGFDMRVPTHHIDAFVLAHGIASQKCAELADTDDVTGRLRDLSNLVDACKKADNNAIVRLQNDTNTNDLPWPYPAIRLPAENDQCLTFTRNVAEVLKDVSSNLGALPPFPLNTLDPRSIITWLSITSTSAVPARARLQLMVSSVEQWFFEAARNLGQSSENPSLLQSSITLVEQILVAHRINCVNLRLQSTGSNLMEVESRSLEVLCVWISHCLVHAAATREHPLLLNYDVALKCSDLQLLVFSEKAPTDAVLAVAAYLKSYKKSRPMIFSLSDQSGTFRMAKEFSLSNPSILSIWDGESRFAEARKDENYMNVQKKQRTAAGLRVEIAEREQKLEVLRSTLEDLRIMILPPAHELKVTRHQIDCEDRSISHCQTQLRTALKSPPMVYLPLPEDKDAAMTVLFFCHMPDNLRTLGRLTFMAQQMLLPRDPFSDAAAGIHYQLALTKSMAVDVTSQLSLWEYYYKYSFNAAHTEPNNVLLRYRGTISVTVPRDVDCYNKKSDGTWHPDSLERVMSWTGGDYAPDKLAPGDYNPFNGAMSDAVKAAQTLFFTEPLSSERGRDVSWALRLGHSLESETLRGNKGIAELDRKPDFLNKPQFLSFCAMRSYPNMQLRNILMALKADNLPLDCPEVLTLLKQTLYHIGVIGFEADTGQEPTLSWKKDAAELYPKVQDELYRLVDQLRDSPKNHLAMHLVGEVAVFVTQQLPSCRDLTRLISDITFGWATAIDAEVEALALGDCTDPKTIHEHRAKQFIFYSYSILCHRSGDLTAEDAARVVELTVLARNVRTFGDSTKHDADVNAFDISVERAMTGMAARLHVALSGEGFSVVFTAAVRAVVASLPALLWSAMDGALCCFEATDTTGSHPRLLSLNAVSGVVLCDGLPPRRLPHSVTDNAMYVRSFGKRDFEVTVSAGVYRASRPLSGCIYEFTPPRDKAALIIREIDVDSGIVLQLLDHGPLGEWKTELPMRLREQYSHWYSMCHKSIILRPIPVLERRISYLLTGDFADSGECRSNVIPLNYQGKSMLMLLEMAIDQPHHFHRLVKYEPHLVTEVMKRIESPVFVETSITDEKSFIIFLPRFDLSFKTGTDGTVHSLDHKGYYLARTQQLEGTLRNFREYLVLENGAGDVMVLIPTGSVMMHGDCDAVTTAADGKSNAKRQYYSYIVNPRLKMLEGSDIAAQLHLAALYAATATALPELLTGRTGDEVAIQILRECFVNRPLSPQEHSHLLNLSQYRNRDPILILLCHDLYRSSTLLRAMRPLQSSVALEPILFDQCAATQYVQNRRGGVHHRNKLSSEEESRLFNKSVFSPSDRRRIVNGMKSYSGSCIDLNTVTKIEDELLSMVGDKLTDDAAPTFPLRSRDCEVGKKIICDLRTSMAIHRALPTKQLLRLPDKSLGITVSVKRKMVEEHLLVAIDTVPDLGRESALFKIWKSTNAVSSITLADLMRIALIPDTISTFNPFFSDAAIEAIKADVLLWLQLCVLEDKMKRITRLAEGKRVGDDLLIQELLTKRNWSVVKYPYWLVYEAANALQIRPTQFDVAMSLIENEGAIVQLNMGEGKTRVILPMLILYWGSVAQGRGSVTRLHFLGQLLDEGYAHLHRQLSRSVLQCKLYLMPFNRDVELDVATAKRMYQAVMTCRESGGCMIMAREHRQSLRLKTHELMLLKAETSQETLFELDKLDDVEYLDMLDESDELLHYRNELVYAVGEAKGLPSGAHRWVAAEAVLFALNFDPAVKLLLETPDLRVCDTAGHENTSEAFRKIRLLEGEVLDTADQSLRQAIARSILDNPPHKMRWMKKVSVEEREEILGFICEPVLNISSRYSEAGEESAEDLLSLRGLLAYGILVNCLQKKHRVNYGIKRIGGKKRSVVPFRASDVPSERSEFSHPDINIVLTMLSYYSDGLSESQLREALTSLFGLGDSERNAIYKEWLGLSKGSMPAEDFQKMDEAMKIDQTNPGQFSLFYKHFRHNMLVVNCWLTWSVFPTECMQYPKKLSANAWNLPGNQSIACRGFSGTDDRKLLLPLQVHSQVVQEGGVDGVLSATNGKMIHLMTTYAEYEHLDVNVNANAEGSSKKSWHAVVERAQVRGCIALLDAGALMVGISNSEVANYILETMPCRPEALKAVLFFNTDKNINGWQIRDSEGRVWPRHASPINERECFVIFDESRCIGTDVKMPETAQCMLTIGTKMCKDKLLQAAGRARMLGRGQTLLLLGMSDVACKLRFASSLTPEQRIEPLHVLEWVIDNSIAAVKEGLLLWAVQGVHFCMTQGATGAQYALQNEIFLLESMYGQSLEAQIPAIVQRESADTQLKRRKDDTLSDGMQDIYLQIVARCKELGSDYKTILKNADDECERELEQEVLKEKLTERQFTRKVAKAEADWNFDTVTTKTMEKILIDAGARSLAVVINTLSDPSSLLGSIPWSGANVYCSANFAKTITCDVENTQQQHLRPADAILYFHETKAVLLLSEREADSIVQCIRSGKQTVSNVRFIHLACCKRKKLIRTPAHVPFPSLLGSASFDEVCVDPKIVAILQLYNGDTMYEPEVKAALAALLLSKQAKTAALNMPELRGLGHMISRSDLEDVCAI